MGQLIPERMRLLSRINYYIRQHSTTIHWFDSFGAQSDILYHSMNDGGKIRDWGARAGLKECLILFKYFIQVKSNLLNVYRINHSNPKWIFGTITTPRTIKEDFLLPNHCYWSEEKYLMCGRVSHSFHWNPLHTYLNRKVNCGSIHRPLLFLIIIINLFTYACVDPTTNWKMCWGNAVKQSHRFSQPHKSYSVLFWPPKD